MKTEIGHTNLVACDLNRTWEYIRTTHYSSSVNIESISPIFWKHPCSSEIQVGETSLNTLILLGYIMFSKFAAMWAWKYLPDRNPSFCPTSVEKDVSGGSRHKR